MSTTERDDRPVYPLIEVFPDKNILGKILGGVRFSAFTTGSQELIPLRDDDGKELESLPYGLVQVNHHVILRPVADWWLPEHGYEVVLNMYGNAGEALMRMSNIVCDALLHGTHDPEEFALDGKRLSVWGPMDVVSEQGAYLAQIAITFPAHGANTAALISKVIGHRDYAHAQLLRASQGIAESNMAKTIKRQFE